VHSDGRLQSNLKLPYSRTIETAIVYLHDSQQPEGGWVGSWGICFTYATQFALESLSLAGETYATSQSSRKACEFLLGKQRADGGWGESYKVKRKKHRGMQLTVF
jgi:lanosterol synthase